MTNLYDIDYIIRLLEKEEKRLSKKPLTLLKKHNKELLNELLLERATLIEREI
jgi:hypothetical protein